MNPETDQVPRRRARPPEDFDAHANYLYPGDVEDAMPEGTWARLLATYLIETILRVSAALDRDSAYANLPIYYRKGDPKRHVSPDAFFLPGVPYDPHCRSYCLWETGVIPGVVFEILSRGSERKDRVANRRIYEELGIREYYWFDPETRELEALILDPSTRQYRERDPDPQGRYPSEALRLEVGVVETAIALYLDGAYLPPTAELLRESDRRLADTQRRLADTQRRLDESDRRLDESDRRLVEERRSRAEAEERIRDLEQRLRDAGPREP